MDNQQNIPGTPAPGNDVRVQNAGAATGNTPASRIGASNTEGPGVSAPASASSRKSAGSASAQGASNAVTQGSANSSSQSGSEGQQVDNQDGTFLNTALESGKKWIEDSGVLNSVNQLPQSLKDFGNRALTRVNDLTTTQKVVGGTLLAVGLGWLATRKGKSSDNARSSNGFENKSRYGRNYGYQTPNASRTPTSGRQDGGSLYGNSRGSYGSGSNYTSGATSSNTGTNSGSGRANSGSGFGSSSANDAGARTAESSYRSKDNDFRSIE